MNRTLSTVLNNNSIVLQLKSEASNSRCVCGGGGGEILLILFFVELNGLALLAVHRNLEIDLDTIVDMFARQHPRRLQLLNILED